MVSVNYSCFFILLFVLINEFYSCFFWGVGGGGGGCGGRGYLSINIFCYFNIYRIFLAHVQKFKN